MGSPENIMMRASSDESLAHMTMDISPTVTLSADKQGHAVSQTVNQAGSTPAPATKFELFDRLYRTDPQVRADVDAIDAMIRLTP